MNIEAEKNNECGFHIDKSKINTCIDKENMTKLLKFENSTDINLDHLKKKYNCNTELCVVKKSAMPEYEKTKIINLFFKPSGPRNSFEWFSNVNIDNVLSQISKRYNKFYHIPFQMRDFMTTKTELCTFNFVDVIKNGFTSFGTVFNTDFSYGKGIHWFALFGVFKNNEITIEYFNSSGEAPFDELLVWFKQVKKEWSNTYCTKTIIVTKLQHQNDNHSCGAYSLFYIMSRLQEISYTYFQSNIITDKDMHEFRKALFRDK